MSAARARQGRGAPAADTAITLEEVQLRGGDLRPLPAVARFVADWAVACGAGRVECSLPLDHPCSRYLAHLGPAVGVHQQPRNAQCMFAITDQDALLASVEPELARRFASSTDAAGPIPVSSEPAER